MLKSDEIKNLTAALIKVQTNLRPAAKEGYNPHFKSNYADLNAVWDACRDLLTQNGLAVIQTNSPAADAVIVETTLAHESGEWISSELLLPLSKKDPQGVGSAITYGRRYGLAAIVGIVADEDDDGNAASTKPNGSNGSKPNNETAHPGQITAIAILCNGKGLVFKDYILAAFPNVKSSAELTKTQAEELIKKLNAKN